ncbi:DUF3667 domain-containing protein [Roseateles sp. BYS180W]|uniref:DUF3667 domain-containing protein n=1 Tax=Roseateles rivi TaxID=3299028 RepID=A0ABW7FWM2_9BURK
MSATSAALTPQACRNCHTVLPERAVYCPTCGQDVAEHPPTLWEFVHEFANHYVALEGKLWKSLVWLLCRPGFLTREYLAGRRQRYVLPLRLLLTLGFVFFVTLKWVDSSGPAVSVQVGAAEATPAQAQAAAFEAFGDIGQVQVGWFESAFEAVTERWVKNPQAEAERLHARLLGMAPWAVLASLPVFAGILALVYRRRRISYGAHFVFAMHLHAAWYGMLWLSLLPVSALAWFLLLWANLYPVLAMRAVYGGRWGVTLLRASCVAAAHYLVLVPAAVLVFALSAGLLA